MIISFNKKNDRVVDFFPKQGNNRISPGQMEERDAREVEEPPYLRDPSGRHKFENTFTIEKFFKTSVSNAFITATFLDLPYATFMHPIVLDKIHPSSLL